VRSELLVNHRIGTVEIHIRFLHVNPECIMVDRGPERESDNLVIHPESATDQA